MNTADTSLAQTWLLALLCGLGGSLIGLLLLAAYSVWLGVVWL